MWEERKLLGRCFNATTTKKKKKKKKKKQIQHNLIITLLLKSTATMLYPNKKFLDYKWSFFYLICIDML